MIITAVIDSKTERYLVDLPLDSDPSDPDYVILPDGKRMRVDKVAAFMDKLVENWKNNGVQIQKIDEVDYEKYGVGYEK